MTRTSLKPPSERTRLRRAPDKASYDRTVIDSLLDACPVAHVGYVLDGTPIVTPTLQWREGDHVYWHGSSASRMLKTVNGAAVCLTVTVTDALLLARSALEHSVNYRSAMLFGQARLVTDATEKAAHLKTMMDQMFPGRWPQLRPMTDQELKATAILTMPIIEASAKISSGMPDDPPQDRNWPVWAGLIPLVTTFGPAQPAPDCLPDMAMPEVRFG